MAYRQKTRRMSGDADQEGLVEAFPLGRIEHQIAGAITARSVAGRGKSCCCPVDGTLFVMAVSVRLMPI